ncbi:MAG TPA: MFS transporter [Gammaproteobacteria bacterium]|jgi:POT family proton-dependent oligopeptide transporter|nr:MFS transporter [Gammaproteobacteria bacterium]HAT26003.1 MFS transporter [Gammaproteobacteria bacterium]
MTDTAINRTGTGEFLGHPTGLVVCFLTEMWERFSYYGMRALLIFYLTQHFLFTDGAAAGIYGAYISLVYITPVIGGMVADRYLGPSKAVILGALLLVAGHAGMAIEGAQAMEVTVRGQIEVQRDPFYLQLFYLSLALIIMGVGFLKANISTLVGSMYERKDARRDGAFTLFYMGINLGSFLGAIACGFLLQYKGFSWGFGAAGVGMLAGLVVFLRGRHLFGDAGQPSNPALLSQNIGFGLNREILVYLLSLLGVLVFWQLIQFRAVVGGILSLSLVSMTAIVIGYAFTKCEREDRNRMIVCLFLMSYQIVFWGLFEQTGSSLNLMTDRNVDRIVFGFEIPAAAFQSVNAFFIITLAPIFSAGWLYLARRGWEPSTPMKFALSLIQLGLGFLFLVYGASLASDPTQVALVWLVLLYLLHTTGELCISPVGLSMTTKLSAPKVVGMMMGCWFLASAAGNYVSGTIAAMTGSDTIGGEVVDPGAALATYMEVYSTAGWYSIGAGVLCILLVPLLKYYMHGIK